MTGEEMHAIRKRLGVSKVNLANLLQFRNRDWRSARRKISRMEDGREKIGELTAEILRDLDKNGLPARPILANTSGHGYHVRDKSIPTGK